MFSITHGVVLPVPVDEHGEGAVDGGVLGDRDLALEGPSHLHIQLAHPRGILNKGSYSGLAKIHRIVLLCKLIYCLTPPCSISMRSTSVASSITTCY